MPESATFGNFHAFLKREINSYRGKVKGYIYYLPALFKALCGLLDQRELEAGERRMILSALGYLVAPNDVIPESIYGPAGYVDDVFVCSIVLDRIGRAHGMEYLEPYWEKDTEPLEEFLKTAIEESRTDLGGKAAEVLDFTGLGE